jgi:hypothetical protein
LDVANILISGILLFFFNRSLLVEFFNTRRRKIPASYPQT